MFGITTNNKGKVEKNKKVKEGKCLFPFNYKWETHNKCVKTEKGDICATSLIETSKKRTLKTYGYCQKRKTFKIRKKKLKIKSKKESLYTLKKKIETKKFKRKLVSHTKQSKMIFTRKQKLKKSKSLNEDLINLLDRLEKLMTMKKEPFRARAYQKAAETIMLVDKDITDISQLKGKPGIGSTIMDKFKEYLETGTLKLLESAKMDPIFTLVGVHGIGYKNAKKLVEEHGITSIVELRENQDLLNDVQKKGLKHYEDVLKRIPRAEIVSYEKALAKVFDKLENRKNSKFQIVGSYLRGAKTSGDIDIIITNSDNNSKIFKEFIDALEKKNILVDTLTKGAKKSMAVGKMGETPARRLDFMYSSPVEFPFATLYFTGNKAFNVVMRQRAVDLGYTMNEHGLYKLVKVAGKKKLQKGKKVDLLFPTEQSIFQFLGMVYKNPTERNGGKAVELIGTNEPMQELGVVEENKSPKINKKVFKKRKTLKIKNKKKSLTKDRLLEFGKNGINVLKRLTEGDLSEMIIYANDAYYNKDQLIDDNTYDILKEYIERVYPENTTIQLVGAPISKNKVALPYQMWSQNKIKPDTRALKNWMKKYKGPYVISGKLDGISALYVQDKSGEQKLYTRGEATRGMDISYLIPYLQLPDSKETHAIRGELIIKRATFEKNYEGSAPGKYKNPRNFVAGVVNTKKREPKKWHDLDFVAYEVIEPELKPSKQMDWLKKNNVLPVLNLETKKISNEKLSEILVDWRESGEYEYDGIVVSNDKIYSRVEKNPDHAFAFKMVLSDQIAEAKVIDVLWSPSKDGLLKPVIQIEPIRLKGVDIEYATAYNAKFVKDNKIGIGALIQMVRSGDVIPKILKVIKESSEPKMPDVAWKWNKSKVDAIMEDFESDDVVIMKNIENFFKKLDVVGLGRGNIKRLMDAGFRTIPTILEMEKDDFMEAEGFKEKMATKVYNSIHEKIKTIPLSTLMAATNIFGRGMGSRRIKEILEKYPDILKSNDSNSNKIKKIASIHGFKITTAELFVNYIDDFLEFMHETKLEYKLKKTKSIVKNVDKSHILYKKKVVFTGFRDKDLIDQIESTGGEIGSSVSKNTFVVVVKNTDESTSTTQKAEKLNIPILTKTQFVKKYL
tara:strand:+ start:29 stop:3403 length:3375 start_codon:yes stop_codon:yes gene_type:complete